MVMSLLQGKLISTQWLTVAIESTPIHFFAFKNPIADTNDHVPSSTTKGQ